MKNLLCDYSKTSELDSDTWDSDFRLLKRRATMQPTATPIVPEYHATIQLPTMLLTIRSESAAEIHKTINELAKDFEFRSIEEDKDATLIFKQKVGAVGWIQVVHVPETLSIQYLNKARMQQAA
jgi:hypothetical protein